MTELAAQLTPEPTGSTPLRLRRSALDIGLVALVVVLTVGAVLGSGLAQTVMSMQDPLTWLRNLRGELTRVNPETGTSVDRLPGLGQAGDPLSLVQSGNVLVVTNRRTTP